MNLINNLMLQVKIKNKKQSGLDNFLNTYLSSLNSSITKMDKKKIYQAANLIEGVIKKNKTIYVCGNGGSAAIANHFICDYFKVLCMQTNLKAKVKSLCSDFELISAISNDISYDDIFLYQAERLLSSGDLLILISSSGDSNNLKKVLQYANQKRIKSIGFSGFKGGYLKKFSTVPVFSNISNYGISEDINHILMHLIMQYIKLKNIKSNYKNPLL